MEVRMSGSNFLPASDSGLLSWSANFGAQLTAGGGTDGPTMGQAVEYTEAQSTYALALTAATDPITRTSAKIEAKNTAKTALIAMSRELARIVQAYPLVTNARRIELGLTVRKTPAPIPAPTEAPSLDITQVRGRTISVRVHRGGTLRGKPEGVSGFRLFSFVGENPPSDLRLWAFQLGDTRTTGTIVLSDSVAAGSRVWLCACWLNPTQQAGPLCDPVGTYAQYGAPTGVQGVEADGAGELSAARTRKAA
jgi:hypothetical protein